MEEARDITSLKLGNVSSKKEGILEAQRDKKKVHFASLMDICHLTKAELEPKEQKYQGRVVLRGDIVKDDSEAYAVFTEQGSSASHFMDVIARLPGLWWTSSWRRISIHWGKDGRCSRLLRISKSECPDVWIRFSATWMTQVMGKHWWSSGSSRTKFVCTPTRRIVVGKTVRRNSVGTWMGVSTELRMCSSKTRIILVRKCGWCQNWLEWSRTWLPCGRNWWRMLTLT